MRLTKNANCMECPHGTGWLPGDGCRIQHYLLPEDIERESLVQYQGGGYDGCHWEWNYAYLDMDGVFWDIASSGRHGAQCAEKLAYELTEEGQRYYSYRMSDPEKVQEFCDEAAPQHVLGVARWWAEQPPGVTDFQDGGTVDFTPTCGECGGKFSIDEDISADNMTGWRGINAGGGWGMGSDYIQAFGWACEDCRWEHTCEECGEYVNEMHPEISGLCYYCGEKELEAERAEEDREMEEDKEE